MRNSTALVLVLIALVFVSILYVLAQIGMLIPTALMLALVMLLTIFEERNSTNEYNRRRNSHGIQHAEREEGLDRKGE